MLKKALKVQQNLPLHKLKYDVQTIRDISVGEEISVKRNDCNCQDCIAPTEDEEDTFVAEEVNVLFQEASIGEEDTTEKNNYRDHSVEDQAPMGSYGDYQELGVRGAAMGFRAGCSFNPKMQDMKEEYAEREEKKFQEIQAANKR